MLFTCPEHFFLKTKITDKIFYNLPSFYLREEREIIYFSFFIIWFSSIKNAVFIIFWKGKKYNCFKQIQEVLLKYSAIEIRYNEFPTDKILDSLHACIRYSLYKEYVRNWKGQTILSLYRYVFQFFIIRVCYNRVRLCLKFSVNY